jgi:polar amino acid transport system substrate-binding protein
VCACQFPADTDGTLDRVRGGTLRVGVTPANPFVILADRSEPQGVEVELVKRFARGLGARVEWVPVPNPS